MADEDSYIHRLSTQISVPKSVPIRFLSNFHDISSYYKKFKTITKLPKFTLQYNHFQYSLPKINPTPAINTVPRPLQQRVATPSVSVFLSSSLLLSTRSSSSNSLPPLPTPLFPSVLAFPFPSLFHPHARPPSMTLCIVVSPYFFVRLSSRLSPPPFDFLIVLRSPVSVLLMASACFALKPRLHLNRPRVGGEHVQRCVPLVLLRRYRVNHCTSISPRLDWDAEIRFESKTLVGRYFAWVQGIVAVFESFLLGMTIAVVGINYSDH